MTVPSSYTYQWKRGGVAISGATSSTYTLQAADNNTQITCTVTGINTYGSTPSTSAATPTITSTSTFVSDNFAGANGAGVNNAFWVTTGVIAPATVQIQGNSAQFVLGSVSQYQGGANLRSVLSETDSNAIVTMTPQTTPVQQYGIIGLRCDGSWNSAQPNNGYYINYYFGTGEYVLAANVAGATVPLADITGGPTGVPMSARIQCQGTTISCKVWAASATEPTSWDAQVTDTRYTSGYAILTAQNGGSATATTMLFNNFLWTSAAAITSVPINTTLPVITGTAEVGLVVSLSGGNWSGSPSSFTYQWNGNGTAISGATGATYTPGSTDLGHTLTCTVIAINALGSSAAVTTAASAAVVASGAIYNPGE
jgi:hypothetical protein